MFKTPYIAIEPRKGKDGRRLTYSLTDFFREYKKECGMQYGRGYTKRMVPRSLFLSILEMYLTELAKDIIISRCSFRMPRRLGELMIVKRKCITGEKQERRIGFPTITEENKEKLRYFAQNLYRDHYFKWKWIKVNGRGTVAYVGWFTFSVTKSAKKFLSDHVYECGTNRKVKDYDVAIEVDRFARNPLKLPAP